jgi:hypothetical protein
LRKRLIYGAVAVVALILLFMVVKSLGKKKGGATPGKTGKTSAQVGDSLKGGTRRARKTKDAVDSLGNKAGQAAKSAGKLAKSAGRKGKRGSLQGQSPTDVASEKKRLREEKKRLKQELRRKKREERLRDSEARRAGRRKRTRGKGSLYDAYTLKGTVAGSYALVGSRRLEKGDVVAGKKIVEIGSDRVVVEQFGTQFTIRLGEPIDLGLTTKSKKR